MHMTRQTKVNDLEIEWLSWAVGYHDVRWLEVCVYHPNGREVIQR